MEIPTSEKAFEQLIFENQAMLIKVCNIFCKSQADKDDLFQEITINLWKGLSSFKGNSKLSTWIYRVSLNTAISDAGRKRKRLVQYTEKLPESTVINSNENAVDEEQIQMLYTGIDRLKPVEKALVLLYLEEHSYSEIADIMGISEKNAGVKLHRIKRKLEKILQPYITLKHAES
jgi:RNA polymerase sigma-70 factor (ECF subfamily)